MSLRALTAAVLLFLLFFVATVEILIAFYGHAFTGTLLLIFAVAVFVGGMADARTIR